MKKLMFLLIFCLLSLAVDSQIIADHTVVDRYDDIPSRWIDSIKKMHLYIPGESHSLGYRDGLVALEALDPTYQVNAGFEQAPTSSYLRYSNNISASPPYAFEEDYWYVWEAYPTYIEKDTIFNILDRNETHGHPIDAIGYGWCAEMMSSYRSMAYDPVYGTRWWGNTNNSPGYKAHGWGLDTDDYAITGNLVSLDTYLAATDSLQKYCIAQGYDTKVIYTTGTVDSINGYYGEPGYQRYLKNERIRDWVAADANRILLDYEDILCYDNGSETRNDGVYTYDGVNYAFPYITHSNASPLEGYHISQAGALRLGKAIWWMLARMAGWDGGTTGTQDLSEDKLSSPLIKYTRDEIIINIEDTFLATTASLYNLKGSLLSTQAANGDSIIINIANLPAGIYFVVLSNSKNTKTHKILIS